MINFKININPIDSQELEITVLGNGKKNGESIVLHLGNGKWAIIDSCKVSETDDPLPLLYLKSINVSPENVAFVICSHWHEDHYNGIDEILSICTKARFFIPNVGDLKNFSTLITFNSKLLNTRNIDNNYLSIDKDKTSETLEMISKCSDILFKTNRRIEYIRSDKDIKLDASSIFLTALSPTEGMDSKLRSLLFLWNIDNPNTELISKIEENMCSASFSYYTENTSALVGGDLENNKPEKRKSTIEDCSSLCSDFNKDGWCYISSEYDEFRRHKPYSLFKLPHHGSVTAYCPNILKNAITENAVGISTIFNGKGEALPRKDMVKEYRKFIRSMYLTFVSDESDTVDTKDDSVKVIDNVLRDNNEEQQLECELEDVEGNVELINTTSENWNDKIGIIIARRKKESEQWTVHPLGTARLLNDTILSTYHKTFFDRIKSTKSEA